jgi:acyl-CoA synthetase
MLPGSYINEDLKKLYYERGHWSTLTVFDNFVDMANKNPDKIAVVDKYQKISYKSLLNSVLKFSSGLINLNVKKGNFVSVQLPNWVENVIAYLSCARIGAVYNPIPTTARFTELEYMVSLCESKVLIIPEIFGKFNYLDMVVHIKEIITIPNVIVVNKEQVKLDQPNSFISFTELTTISPINDVEEKVAADDPLVVLFTSGTESQPKGVIHTHNTVLFGERTMAETLQITQDDAVFMASPVSHATGFLHGVNLPFLVGAKSVLMEHFHAKEALQIISNEKCTFSMGATPFLHDILKELFKSENEYDLSSFRFFLCGGAPIPRNLVERAKEIGFKVLAVYGSSESPPHATSRLDDTDELIVSYDGTPLPGIEVRIVDEDHAALQAGEVGEEASRGANVFIGYYKRPELTSKYLDSEGWYYSGDLCTLNPEKYLKVVGRKKDIIIRGGQNISPSEIEDILYKHPKIKNVAIVGIPDERMGEKACAFIVPNEGQIIMFDEMIEFLALHNIAKYKYPEKLELIDNLPMTASGKIQKFMLSKMIKGVPN